MLKIKKTLDQLMNETFDKVNSISYPNGHTVNLSPGSMVRLIMSCVNDELVSMYDLLNSVHLNAYLSTASGEYIDLIGYLLNCKRFRGESDENYKYRISSQVTVMERCNELSVRMSLLNIEGVDDVYFEPYTYGSGSFTAYISSVNANSELIDTCYNTLKRNVAYGIKYEIKEPTYLFVKIGIKIMFKRGELDNNSELSTAKETIKSYIDNRKLGESIIISDIISSIMNLSDKIYDVEIFKLDIDSIDYEIADINSLPTEKFLCREVSVC